MKSIARWCRRYFGMGRHDAGSRAPPPKIRPCLAFRSKASSRHSGQARVAMRGGPTPTSNQHQGTIDFQSEEMIIEEWNTRNRVACCCVGQVSW